MEPKYLLPSSHKLAAELCPEREESYPYPHSVYLRSTLMLSSIYAWAFILFLTSKFYHCNCVCISYFISRVLTPPPTLILLDYRPKTYSGGAQNANTFIMHYSLSSCYFILRPKYLLSKCICELRRNNSSAGNICYILWCSGESPCTCFSYLKIDLQETHR
jgi:hypothetical protein